MLKEGDEVTALIINVDRKTRNIQLSIKAKDHAHVDRTWCRCASSESRL